MSQLEVQAINSRANELALRTEGAAKLERVQTMCVCVHGTAQPSGYQPARQTASYWPFGYLNVCLCEIYGNETSQNTRRNAPPP